MAISPDEFWVAGDSSSSGVLCRRCERLVPVAVSFVWEANADCACEGSGEMEGPCISARLQQELLSSSTHSYECTRHDTISD